MFHHDCIVNCEPIDQLWFAMLLGNDPNAALVGTLRPPQENVPQAASDPTLESHLHDGFAVEGAPPLRSRAPRWLAVGLFAAVLGFAASAVDAPRSPSVLASASSERASERTGLTALVRAPVPGSEPPADAARPLRALLDVKSSATPSPAVTKKASPKTRAARNWLAASRLASR